MATLKIENIPPYDGEYELDISSFSNRELHVIKQETGLRAGEFPEALKAGDNDLVVAFTGVILRRNGIDVNMDLIWDADAGHITVDTTDEEQREDEERPPAIPTPGGDENELGVEHDENEKLQTSGASSD